MSTDDPSTPDSTRANGDQDPGEALRPPGPGSPGSTPPPAAGQMPGTVSGLRVMMVTLAGLQAVLGLALITNSADVATSLWNEARSGRVIFTGALLVALAAWGITTALKFPTRHPRVRTSAVAYSWTGLPFALAAFQVTPILGALVLILAILLTVRPNQPESRAWFSGRRV
ncbi:hypothetical protein [Streptomyces sp. NPDC048669]|uniref:hypothetical protein n=1 Tax=Streptomyces sp. NPDC048669 TaxID=3155267 RepID=UPI003433786F